MVAVRSASAQTNKQKWTEWWIMDVYMSEAEQFFFILFGLLIYAPAAVVCARCVCVRRVFVLWALSIARRARIHRMHTNASDAEMPEHTYGPL